MPYSVEGLIILAFLVALVTAAARRHTRPEGVIARGSGCIALVAVMAIMAIVLYEVFFHNRLHHILSTVGSQAAC